MSSDSRASQWLSSNLAAIGSAAVLTVYAAGYARTKPAADRLAEESERRRPNARPTPMVAAGHVGEVTPASPASEPAPAESAQPAAQSPAQQHADAAAPIAAAKQTKAVANADSVTSTAPAPAPAATVAQAPSPAPTVSAPVSTPTPTPAAPAAVAPAAPAPAQQTPALSAQDNAAPKPAGYKDGVYSGWGTSRHGDIQAYVEIKGGKIVSAFISECLTQYSCSWIAKLPPQVVERQSAEIDYVSGATQSSNALYYAVVNALKTAK